MLLSVDKKLSEKSASRHFYDLGFVLGPPIRWGGRTNADDRLIALNLS